MTTAMQDIKYTNEGIQFIVDHEEARTTNEQNISNNYQYEFQTPYEMNAENKRKRKWNSQIGPKKYHKNNLPSYKSHDDIKKKPYSRNRSYSDLEHKQVLNECESINEDHIQNKKYNPENTDIDNNVHEHHVITTVQSQKSKTPISLLNEWAMRGDGSCEKKQLVSYTLVAITGQAHRPIFTYMCRLNDKTAKGEGQSKKEAKQNAAAQMWEKLFKTSSTTNNDKVITSTTITNNFEVNENDATNLTNTEGSQIIYETDSNIEDEELLQHSNYDVVKIAHCNMNPVGALQELSTAYKWIPPFYSFEKLGPLKNGQQQIGMYKILCYKVTCKVFHLQTTGIASNKKEAKRLAARLMFDQIRNIGEEKLNTLKSLEFKNECEIEQKENQKLPLKWNAALSFQSYITTAISEAMNIISNSSSSYFQFEGKKNEEEMYIKTEYQQELEQTIVQFNSNLSAIDQLQTLSQQLNFQITYMCVDTKGSQQIKNNTGPDEKFTILIQVTTAPVIATMGQAKSLYDAAEVAARSILHTFQNLLIYTSFSFIQNQKKSEQVGQSTM